MLTKPEFNGPVDRAANPHPLECLQLFVARRRSVVQYRFSHLNLALVEVALPAANGHARIDNLNLAVAAWM
ncbi:unnamed protein product [Soboliphyme baturini]|uniref:Transposase n=1 Tax=Soboliphyme baturini TaxID=241478 RepID=A0A183I8Y1_9BILA|nr:unnamed protein product [Soboliphyme baturini]